MRLIDADHLKSMLHEYVKREQSYINIRENRSVAMGHKNGLLEAIAQIDEEETVEPQRMRGKWINEGIYGEGDSLCSIRCPNPLCNFHYIGYLDDYKFCPNCGSDMRGTKDVD